MRVQMRPLRRRHLQSAEGAHLKSKMELPVYKSANNRDAKLGNFDLPLTHASAMLTPFIATAFKANSRH